MRAFLNFEKNNAQKYKRANNIEQIYSQLIILLLL